MMCPYCKLLDLNDEAVVCPHCQKDLILYQPIAKRSTDTELKLKKLYEKMGPVEIGPGSVVVFSITIAFLSDYISWLSFADGWKALPFQSLAVLAPMLAGLLLGWQRHRMTRFGAMANGTIAGLGGFATHVMVWAFGKLQSANSDCIDAMARMKSEFCHKTELLPPHWYVSALTYPIVGAFLLYSGQILGRKIGSAPSSDWDDDEQQSGGSGIIGLIAALIVAILSRLWEHYVGS